MYGCAQVLPLHQFPAHLFSTTEPTLTLALDLGTGALRPTARFLDSWAVAAHRVALLAQLRPALGNPRARSPPAAAETSSRPLYLFSPDSAGKFLGRCVTPEADLRLLARVLFGRARHRTVSWASEEAVHVGASSNGPRDAPGSPESAMPSSFGPDAHGFSFAQTVCALPVVKLADGEVLGKDLKQIQTMGLLTSPRRRSGRFQPLEGPKQLPCAQGSPLATSSVGAYEVSSQQGVHMVAERTLGSCIDSNIEGSMSGDTSRMDDAQDSATPLQAVLQVRAGSKLQEMAAENLPNNRFLQGLWESMHDRSKGSLNMQGHKDFEGVTCEGTDAKQRSAEMALVVYDAVGHPDSKIPHVKGKRERRDSRERKARREVQRKQRSVYSKGVIQPDTIVANTVSRGKLMTMGSAGQSSVGGDAFGAATSHFDDPPYARGAGTEAGCRDDLRSGKAANTGGRGAVYRGRGVGLSMGMSEDGDLESDGLPSHFDQLRQRCTATDVNGARQASERVRRRVGDKGRGPLESDVPAARRVLQKVGNIVAGNNGVACASKAIRSCGGCGCTIERDKFKFCPECGTSLAPMMA